MTDAEIAKIVKLLLKAKGVKEIQVHDKGTVETYKKEGENYDN